MCKMEIALSMEGSCSRWMVWSINWVIIVVLGPMSVGLNALARQWWGVRGADYRKGTYCLGLCNGAKVRIRNGTETLYKPLQKKDLH